MAVGAVGAAELRFELSRGVDTQTRPHPHFPLLLPLLERINGCVVHSHSTVAEWGRRRMLDHEQLMEVPTLSMMSQVYYWPYMAWSSMWWGAQTLWVARALRDEASAERWRGE